MNNSISRYVRQRSRGYILQNVRQAASTVSPLGWSTLIAAMLTGALFVAWQWVEMLACAIVFAVTFTTAVVLSFGNTALEATLDVASTRARIGQTVNVQAVVSNPNARSTASAAADLPITQSAVMPSDSTTVHKHFHVPSLGARQSTRITAQLCADRRAIITIGPLSVRRGDPFGLMRREQRLTESLTLYVHPQICVLHGRQSGIPRDFEGTPSRDVVDDDLDFHGLRQYEYGDDVRNVHWASTAKTGTLMLRRFVATRRSDSSLVLDTDMQGYTSADQFETAVSVFASIGVHWLTEHRTVFTQAGGLRARPRTPTEFLDACCGIKLSEHCTTDLARETMHRSPRTSLFCFVISPAWSIDDVRRLAAATPTSAQCIIVQLSSAGERGVRMLPECTLVTIGSLEDIPHISGVPQ